MTPALDISQYQGAWQERDEPIVMIKMSGGDAGLYMDAQAASNYIEAVNSGKAVGGYHFIGWTLGATAEATYFMQAMSPVAENDVYALDIEAIRIGVDPVSYVTDMVNTIHDHIGVYPLLYMNLSMLREYDWSALLQLCGLWLADWNNDPAGTIPNIPTYVMQQYSDGPNYDHDEWFSTVERFKMCGYHAPQNLPVPIPDPPIIPEPVVPPVVDPTPEVPNPESAKQPVVVTKLSWYEYIAVFFEHLWKKYVIGE